METEQTQPEEAGTSRDEADARPSLFADKEWITVDEAVVYFRELGLPRSPEAIRGYCRHDKLEATTTQGIKGEQHVIRRESARIYIEERKQVLAAMSRDIPEEAGTTRKLPVTSVTSRHETEDAGTARVADENTLKEKEVEIAKLREEVMSLKIDKSARDHIVTMLRDERSQLMQEAMEKSRRVGELETRLQLTAPSQPHQAADATSDPIGDSAADGADINAV